MSQFKVEDDEDDEWETVYAKLPIEDENFAGMLYETYGGGPSGGYIVDNGGSLVTWHQEWSKPKNYKNLVGKMLQFKLEDGLNYCRVVEKAEKEKDGPNDGPTDPDDNQCERCGFPVKDGSCDCLNPPTDEDSDDKTSDVEADWAKQHLAEKEKGFQIYIKALNGNSFPMIIKPHDTVAVLTHKIQERTREVLQSMENGTDLYEAEMTLWDGHRLGLEFGGQQLFALHNTLSYYDIEKGNTINITYGLVGEGT
jgi:hypothetical protein